MDPTGSERALHPSAPTPTRSPSWLPTAEWTLTLVAPLLLLLVWEVFVQLNLLDRRFFPPPSQLWPVAVGMVEDGSLWDHVEATVRRLATGYLVGALLAGLTIWSAKRWWWLRGCCGIYLCALVVASLTASWPIYALLFGLGERAVGVTVAVAVYWSLLLAFAVGRRRRSVAVDTAASRQWTTVTAFHGLRLGLEVALFVLILGEILGESPRSPGIGVGHLLWQSFTSFSAEKMYIAMLSAAAIGYAGFLLLAELEVLWAATRARLQQRRHATVTR